MEGVQPHPAAQLKHSLCHRESIFSGWETNFLPNSIFKQQVRTKPPPKCLLHAFKGFLPLHLVITAIQICVKRRNNKVVAQDCSASYNGPASCLREKRRAAEKAKAPLARMSPEGRESHPNHGHVQRVPGSGPCTLQR